MRHRRLPAVFLPFLLCWSCTGPADAYIQADRATFDVIAPSYLVYVTNDTNLTEEEKERRRRTIASWQARLRAAEAGR